MVKRVFVVWKHSLFRQSVCRLLVGPSLEVVGDAPNDGGADAAISALQPDIVLVETTGDPDGCFDALGRSQRQGWKQRIICLSLDDNVILMLRPEEHLLTDAQELLQFVLES